MPQTFPGEKPALWLATPPWSTSVGQRRACASSAAALSAVTAARAARTSGRSSTGPMGERAGGTIGVTRDPARGGWPMSRVKRVRARASCRVAAAFSASAWAR